MNEERRSNKQNNREEVINKIIGKK